MDMSGHELGVNHSGGFNAWLSQPSTWEQRAGRRVQDWQATCITSLFFCFIWKFHQQQAPVPSFQNHFSFIVIIHLMPYSSLEAKWPRWERENLQNSCRLNFAFIRQFVPLEGPAMHQTCAPSLLGIWYTDEHILCPCPSRLDDWLRTNSFYPGFWAAAWSIRCPVEHRGNPPSVRPYMSPAIFAGFHLYSGPILPKTCKRDPNLIEMVRIFDGNLKFRSYVLYVDLWDLHSGLWL